MHVRSGSFVRHDCREALLDVGGCEPTIWATSGSVLLHAVRDGWRAVKYFPGLVSQPCHALTLEDGRQRLACQSHWRGAGGGGSTVFVVDLQAEKEVELVSAQFQNTDQSPAACNDWIEISSFGIGDANGDGHADVIVDVMYDATGKRCLSQRRRGKRGRLEFIALADRPAFVPSDPTAAILAFAEDQEKLDPAVAHALRNRQPKRPQPIEPSELRAVAIHGAGR
jgi:hypothetical protein